MITSKKMLENLAVLACTSVIMEVLLKSGIIGHNKEDKKKMKLGDIIKGICDYYEDRIEEIEQKYNNKVKEYNQIDAEIYDLRIELDKLKKKKNANKNRLRTKRS